MKNNDPNCQARLQLINPDDKRWLDFISVHPDSTIFHHPIWLSTLSKCYGFSPFVLSIIDDNDKIIAGVPFMKIKCIIRGLRFVSLPFTDFCQPLTKDDENNGILSKWFSEVYQERKISRIELRWQYPENGSMQKDGTNLKHTIQLTRDSETIAKKFKRSHRQNIQTAMKRGIRIEWGDQLEHIRSFYNLHRETRHRHGVPVQPWSFFKELATTIFRQKLGFVLLGYIEEECIAGIVYLHWKKHLIAKYSASKKSTLTFRPNNLLIWKGIEWGCSNGFSVFDFGRTEKNNHGLCRWKLGWGAIETPLIYSHLSKTSRQSSANLTKKMARFVIQKSPLWTCQCLGEILYRHLG